MGYTESGYNESGYVEGDLALSADYSKAIVVDKTILLSNGTVITDYIKDLKISTSIGKAYSTAVFNTGNFSIDKSFIRSSTNYIKINIGLIERDFIIIDIDEDWEGNATVFCRSFQCLLSEPFSSSVYSLEKERTTSEIIAKYAVKSGIEITNKLPDINITANSFKRDGTMLDAISSIVSVTKSEIIPFEKKLVLDSIKTIPENFTGSLFIGQGEITDVTVSKTDSNDNKIKNILINVSRGDIYSEPKITLMYDSQESDFAKGRFLFNPIISDKTEFNVTGTRLAEIELRTFTFSESALNDFYITVDGGIKTLGSVKIDGIDITGECEFVSGFNVITLGTERTGLIEVLYSTDTISGSIPLSTHIAREIEVSISGEYKNQEINEKILVVPTRGNGENGTNTTGSSISLPSCGAEINVISTGYELISYPHLGGTIDISSANATRKTTIGTIGTYNHQIVFKYSDSLSAPLTNKEILNRTVESVEHYIIETGYAKEDIETGDKGVIFLNYLGQIVETRVLSGETVVSSTLKNDGDRKYVQISNAIEGTKYTIHIKVNAQKIFLGDFKDIGWAMNIRFDSRCGASINSAIKRGLISGGGGGGIAGTKIVRGEGSSSNLFYIYPRGEIEIRYTVAGYTDIRQIANDTTTGFNITQKVYSKDNVPDTANDATMADRLSITAGQYLYEEYVEITMKPETGESSAPVDLSFNPNQVQVMFGDDVVTDYTFHFDSATNTSRIVWNDESKNGYVVFFRAAINCTTMHFSNIAGLRAFMVESLYITSGGASVELSIENEVNQIKKTTNTVFEVETTKSGEICRLPADLKLYLPDILGLSLDDCSSENVTGVDGKWSGKKVGHDGIFRTKVREKKLYVYKIVVGSYWNHTDQEYFFTIDTTNVR